MPTRRDDLLNLNLVGLSVMSRSILVYINLPFPDDLTLTNILRFLGQTKSTG